MIARGPLRYPVLTVNHIDPHVILAEKYDPFLHLSLEWRKNRFKAHSQNLPGRFAVEILVYQSHLALSFDLIQRSDVSDVSKGLATLIIFLSIHVFRYQRRSFHISSAPRFK